MSDIRLPDPNRDVFAVVVPLDSGEWDMAAVRNGDRREWAALLFPTRKLAEQCLPAIPPGTRVKIVKLAPQSAAEASRVLFDAPEFGVATVPLPGGRGRRQMKVLYAPTIAALREIVAADPGVRALGGSPRPPVDEPEPQ